MTLQPAPTQYLTDCFSGLLAYVVSWRQSVVEKQPAYDEVRKEILRLLKESESYVSEGFCTQDEYEQARYAVCAWIDESVLASSWNFKGRWRPELLQRLYYQSADAGEKFFQRLKNLEGYQQSVRAVYYLCLALGFRGRYCESEDGYALEQLKEQHLKLLFNSVSESPSLASLEKNTMFPEAYAQNPPSGRAKMPRRAWGTLAVVAGPVLLFIVLFLTYRFTLSSVGESILKAVRS
jgi:type VI secretion system protein ImpK